MRLWIWITNVKWKNKVFLFINIKEGANQRLVLKALCSHKSTFLNTCIASIIEQKLKFYSWSLLFYTWHYSYYINTMHRVWTFSWHFCFIFSQYINLKNNMFLLNLQLIHWWLWKRVFSREFLDNIFGSCQNLPVYMMKTYFSENLKIFLLDTNLLDSLYFSFCNVFFVSKSLHEAAPEVFIESDIDDRVDHGMRVGNDLDPELALSNPARQLWYRSWTLLFEYKVLHLVLGVEHPHGHEHLEGWPADHKDDHHQHQQLQHVLLMCCAWTTLCHLFPWSWGAVQFHDNHGVADSHHQDRYQEHHNH